MTSSYIYGNRCTSTHRSCACCQLIDACESCCCHAAADKRINLHKLLLVPPKEAAATEAEEAPAAVAVNKANPEELLMLATYRGRRSCCCCCAQIETKEAAGVANRFIPEEAAVSSVIRGPKKLRLLVNR